MKLEFEYPKQQAEFEQFVSENPDSYIWHDGAIMRVFTDEDKPNENNS